MPENRIFTNYGGLTADGFDFDTGDFLTLCAVPMTLHREAAKLVFRIAVWKSIGDFESREPSLSRLFDRVFSFTGDNLAQIRTGYASFIEPMEAAALDWLDVSAESYELDTLSIDLDSLRIYASAKHKTRPKLRVESETNSLEEFEQVKADYPELVQAYFGLIWTYAKTNDAKIAKFN